MGLSTEVFTDTARGAAWIVPGAVPAFGMETEAFRLMAKTALPCVRPVRNPSTAEGKVP